MGSCGTHVHKGGIIAEKLKVILLKIFHPPLSTYLALNAFGAPRYFACNVQMKESREWHAFICHETGGLITGPGDFLGRGSERLPGASCYVHVLASRLSVLRFITASIHQLGFIRAKSQELQPSTGVERGGPAGLEGPVLGLLHTRVPFRASSVRLWRFSFIF